MADLVAGATTTTVGAVFISEHWAKEAQLATRKEQVLAGTVSTKYESEMKTGRTLHIAHVLNQAATAKADGTQVVPDANIPTNQDITVDRYFYTATNWGSKIQTQADIVDINKIAGQFGYALQGQVETDLAGLPDGLSTNVVGTFGQELTMDQWEEIWQKMQVGLAPRDNRTAWLSSAAISAWRKLGVTISSDYSKTGFGALDAGTIGQFLGFRMVESQYLEAPATGQHDCVVFHRDQFGLIRQQQPKVERERILLDLADLVVAWELFTTYETEIIAEAAGAESLTDQWGVWVKTV